MNGDRDSPERQQQQTGKRGSIKIPEDISADFDAELLRLAMTEGKKSGKVPVLLRRAWSAYLRSRDQETSTEAENGLANEGRGNVRIPPDQRRWVDAQLRAIELKEGRPKAKTPELFRRMMACYERECQNKTNNLEQSRDYPRIKNTDNFINNTQLLSETGGTLNALNSADQELLQTIFQALLRRFGAGVLLLLGELLSDATDSFDTTQAGNTDYAAVAASLHERLDALLQRSREDRERADQVIYETGGATEDRIRDSGTNKKSA
jgi:hypothetical protein